MPHGALRRPPPAATRRAAPPPHPAEGPPSRPPPRRSSHLSAAASRAATAVGTVGAAHAAPPRPDLRTCSRAPPRAAAPSRTAGREQPTARLGEKSFNVTRRVKKKQLNTTKPSGGFHRYRKRGPARRREAQKARRGRSGAALQRSPPSTARSTSRSLHGRLSSSTTAEERCAAS